MSAHSRSRECICITYRASVTKPAPLCYAVLHLPASLSGHLLSCVAWVSAVVISAGKGGYVLLFLDQAGGCSLSLNISACTQLEVLNWYQVLVAFALEVVLLLHVDGLVPVWCDTWAHQASCHENCLK